MQLYFELSNLKKTNQSVADYLQKARLIADSLASIGEPILDIELVQAILGGLGPDFEALVTTLLVRSEPFTFEEVQALLLNHEVRLEHSRALFDSYQPQAHYASNPRYTSSSHKKDASTPK
uniref:Retrovirus-related Pol polyprotein from transposon TNT 1-94 n=1 Tax=Nelumbo nucifera TaxID=4432 RepID=A0A822XRL4_NELNU|nr:TPA_asm: hypothetical protein HUJ06_024533 [Nelumbo nucifera]